MRCRTAAAWALVWAAAGPLLAGAVSGRVYDSAGRPVAGARVWWSAFRGEAQALVDADADAARGVAPKPLGETRTGADGRFAATLDAAAGPVALQIEGTALPWAVLPGPFDPGESVEVSDVELPAAAAVSGVVTGAFVVPGGDKAATYSFTVAEGQTTSLPLP